MKHFLQHIRDLVLISKPCARYARRHPSTFVKNARNERPLSIFDRGELAGLDGYDAVLLWNDYERSGNQKALETLLAYNSQDIVNLETLMVLAYNLKLKDTPFFGVNELPEPAVPEIPFKGDLETIERIKVEKMTAFIGHGY